MIFSIHIEIGGKRCWMEEIARQIETRGYRQWHRRGVLLRYYSYALLIHILLLLKRKEATKLQLALSFFESWFRIFSSMLLNRKWWKCDSSVILIFASCILSKWERGVRLFLCLFNLHLFFLSKTESLFWIYMINFVVPKEVDSAFDISGVSIYTRAFLRIYACK